MSFSIALMVVVSFILGVGMGVQIGKYWGGKMTSKQMTELKEFIVEMAALVAYYSSERGFTMESYDSVLQAGYENIHGADSEIAKNRLRTEKYYKIENRARH